MSKKLTKAEINHVKKIALACDKVIQSMMRVPEKERKIFNFIAELNGVKAIDYDEAIKNLKALKKGCIKTIKQEEKKK